MECYFKWCEYHYKDEPFCQKDECVASKDNIIVFTELRKKELDDSYKVDK